MRTVAAHLVAVAVALHSVLGCCWHHAFEHDAEASEGVCAEVHSDGDHHEHDDVVAHADDHACSDEHSPSEPCRHACGGRCVLATADRVDLDRDVEEFRLAPLASNLSFTTEAGLATAKFASRDATTYPPPQRLYLLHQLLLI